MSLAIRLVATAMVAVVAVGAAGVARLVVEIPDPGMSPALIARKPDPAHGRLVALQGDCAGCHTAPGDQPYAGGVAFSTPVGTLYSSNITPDVETGIGRYSLADFIRLMRLGVAPEGKRIYPAMPYTAYAKVSDEDLQDLFAYLRAVAPVTRRTRPAEIEWPLTMRWPLALWNLAFHDKRRFVPDRARDARWNRGAYLVQGLAHCGTCHTPRNFAYAERGLDDASPFYLSGASFDGAAPINLRGNEGDGLGRWSEADIALLLKTGRNRRSAASGSMARVIAASTQYFSDADLDAIAVYLKSLPPAPGEHPGFTPDGATLATYLDGRLDSPGGRLYMDGCAACHRLDGQGAAGVFPALAGNASALARDPSSLIEVILAGSRLPSTAAAPTPLAMPGFAWRYDDSQVAALASFVRAAWGNRAAPVTPGQVTDLRNRLRLH